VEAGPATGSGPTHRAPRSEPASRSPRWRRGAGSVAVALALTGCASAAGTGLAGSPRSAPARSAPARSAPARSAPGRATTAATTTAGGAAGGRPSVAPTLAWTRDQAAALGIGGSTSTLAAVLAPGPGGGPWLIAGTRRTASGASVATVWSSPDATTWRAAALPGVDGRALAAAAWGTRTVVVGSVTEAGVTRAAVWVSPGPGEAFAAVPDTPALDPPTAIPIAPTTPGATTTPTSAGTPPSATGLAQASAAMDVVGAGTQGVFAAGSVAGRQALWYSTDGTDWVRLPRAETVIDPNSSVVTSLLVSPAAIVAAGTVRNGTTVAGAIWTSSDGITWQPYSAPDDPFAGAGDHRIDALAVTPTGSLTAVGGERSGPDWSPASWVSPNGTLWGQASEAVPTAAVAQGDGGGTVVRDVAVTPASTFVAVGGSRAAQHLWTSTDGRTWTEAALPAGIATATDWTADRVATDGPTDVVVDTDPGQPRVLVDDSGRWTQESADPAVFGDAATVATPAGIASDGGRLTVLVDVAHPGAVLGTTTDDVDEVVSSDGTHWRRVSLGAAFAGARVDDLTTVGATLVAVGSAPGGRAGSATVGAVWTSRSGRAWTRTTALGPPGVHRATAVAALGSTPVAVGAAATDPGAPASPDAAEATPAGWTRPRGLDPDPSVGAEVPLAACSDGRTVVAVGDAERSGIPMPATRGRAHPGTTTTSTVAGTGSSAGATGQDDVGTVAAAWSTTDAVTWQPATVSPATGAGGAAQMDGCAATATGWVAWGETPAPSGSPVAAVWTSPDAANWTLATGTRLSGGAPLAAVAVAGRTWVGVGGGVTAAAGVPLDPTVSVADPVSGPSVPPASTGADGAAAVWWSTDAGATWARVATTGSAWTATAQLRTQLVALTSSTLVVIGEIDDRLAVWTAAP
jgi:hypothetical protein